MKEADRQAIALLNQIHDAQAAGGAPSFAAITGSPEDNAALDAALDAKQGSLGYTPVPETRTVNGHALSANVTVSKGDVGLGNADNTADTAKPVSTDQATAIAAKVSDAAYDATSWDGVTTIAPSKNAVRDKIEAVVASIPTAPYLVYTALLTQSGSGDPAATVLYNTLGATITWARSTDGIYTGTASASVFTDLKTACFISGVGAANAESTGRTAVLHQTSSLEVALRTLREGVGLSDDVLYSAGSAGTTVEIRVYP